MDDLSRDEMLLLLRERDALIAVQQEQIQQQESLIRKQQEQLELLASEIQLLKRALYGNRRERFDDPRQGTLCDGEWIDPSPEDDAGEATVDEEDNRSESKPQRGAKRRRRG